MFLLMDVWFSRYLNQVIFLYCSVHWFQLQYFVKKYSNDFMCTLLHYNGVEITTVIPAHKIVIEYSWIDTESIYDIENRPGDCLSKNDPAKIFEIIQTKQVRLVS